MCSLGCLAFMHSGFHFASHAVCARMSFNSIWVSVPASTLRWAKKNQGKVGGWHSPRPKSETLLFGGSICFVLLFFCCFVVFFLVCCFFAFYFTIFQFFCGLSHKISKFEGPQFRSEPSLSADRLTNWQPGAVSLVFCAGFATLWRLICCFHVCCIWHFPFSQAAALLSIFSICHVCLLPTCIGSFPMFSICQLRPFPSWICSFHSVSTFYLCPFRSCILPFHFFCNCHACLFQTCMFNSVFCIVSPFFFLEVMYKHPRTSAKHNRSFSAGSQRFSERPSCHIT